MRRLVIAACLVALGVPGRGDAADGYGIAGFDRRREVVLLGTLDGRSASPGDALTRGSWALGPAGLALTDALPYGDESYWIPTGVDVGDGLVRARIRPSGTTRIDVLIRARIGTADEELSGYGVHLEPDKVFLQRWDRGLVLPTDVEVAVPGLLRHAELEVVFVAVGPQLIAMVHDGASLDLLATVAMHDTSYARGGVGIRADRRQGPDTVVTTLSAMGDDPAPPRPELVPWPDPVTEPEAAAVAATQAEIQSEIAAWEARWSDPPEALGPELLVLVAAEDRRKIPSDLREAVLDDAPELEPGTLVLQTGRVQLERLKRAGVRVLSVSGDVPWWALDADYRKWRDAPIEATRTGLRIDRSYKNPVLVERILRGWAEKFPERVRVVELGRTHQGRPVLALKISDHPELDEDEPAVLLDAAHHGAELQSIEYALDAAQVLIERYPTDARVRRWVDALEIWVVPVVNPDGNHVFTEVNHWSGRKNGRDIDPDPRIAPFEGVDLNRNYPFRWGALGELGSRSWPLHYQYRGPEAASEPETRAMMALADARAFAAGISFHTFATSILAPYTIDGVRNPTGDEVWGIAEGLAAAAPVQPNGRRYTVKRKLYSVDGISEDWLRFAHGTVAFIVEGSHHNTEHAAVRKRAVETTRPVWQALFDRFLDGPSLSGHVRDIEGNPVAAVVDIVEIGTVEGEAWRARARDGRFDRFLPRPGTYTVKVRADGFTPATRTVTVGVERARLDVVLAR